MSQHVQDLDPLELGGQAPTWVLESEIDRVDRNLDDCKGVVQDGIGASRFNVVEHEVIFQFRKLLSKSSHCTLRRGL